MIMIMHEDDNACMRMMMMHDLDHVLVVATHIMSSSELSESMHKPLHTHA
jgi:hypothetical protein